MPKPKPKQPSPTDLLIQELLAADGNRIQIPHDQIKKCQGMIQSAKRLKRTPKGKRITLDGSIWSSGPVWVILEDLPTWERVEATPVPVPDTLRKPSDVVISLRSRDDFRIQRSERNRALRLAEALVREARERGYTVKSSSQQSSYYDRDTGHFTIRVGEDDFALSIHHSKERVPHVMTKHDEDWAARGWSTNKHDIVTSSRLQITLEQQRYHSKQSWKETAEKSLDMFLPMVLQEIEKRHLRDVERREEERRRYEANKARWEAARSRAIDQLNESHRRSVLVDQLEKWELWNRLFPYLKEMTGYVEDHPENIGARDWLDWAKEYATSLNPLSDDLHMPSNPEPTEKSLKPYMQGVKEPWEW